VCHAAQIPVPRYNVLTQHMESKHPAVPIPSEEEVSGPK
jgi:uncharacterized short protein YbdD (DUF466 family)